MEVEHRVTTPGPPFLNMQRIFRLVCVHLDTRVLWERDVQSVKLVPTRQMLQILCAQFALKILTLQAAVHLNHARLVQKTPHHRQAVMQTQIVNVLTDTR